MRMSGLRDRARAVAFASVSGCWACASVAVQSSASAMDPIFVTGPPGGFVSADRTSTGGKSAGGGLDLSYFAWRGTVATCCSHSRRSSPAPPPLSVRVYFRVSTGAGGLLIVILTRPRSADALYVNPHCPVCLLMISSHCSGSLIHT